MKNKDFLTSRKIAHRGIHYVFLENSLLAFEEAMNQGNIIELDVRLSKDDEVIVFHDYSLKRLFHVEHNIRDLNLIEIKEYKSIPTLEEVLTLVQGKVPLLIEIKYESRIGLLEKKTSELLDQYNGEFAIMSFNPLSILWFKLNRSHYICGYLVHSILPDNFLLHFFLNHKLLKYIIKPDFLGVNLAGLKDIDIQKLRKKYLLIGYTIQTKEQYQKYVEKADNFIFDIQK